MAEMFNPLDANRWRDLIADFDRKRVAFFDNLAALSKMRGATPELEQERRSLVKSADPIKKNIERLQASLEGVRGFLKGVGRFFNMGETPGQTMGHLGVAPIVLGIGIAGAAVIVKSITDWLTKTAAFAKRNEFAAQLADAGASPQEIIEATKGGIPSQSSAKIFGFDVRWLLAIGGLVVIAPFVLKQLEKGR